mmetsp:Transcript_197/g.385  ORF Transcript_197/g.385 Transcript_197/m.385 type:complete len:342 (+) Transcript_197:55-1080(+)
MISIQGKNIMANQKLFQLMFSMSCLAYHFFDRAYSFHLTPELVAKASYLNKINLQDQKQHFRVTQIIQHKKFEPRSKLYQVFQEQDEEIEAPADMESCKKRLTEFLEMTGPSSITTRSLYVRNTVRTLLEMANDDKTSMAGDTTKISEIQGEYEVLASFMENYKNAPPGLNFMLSNMVCELQPSTTGEKGSWEMMLTLSNLPFPIKDNLATILVIVPRAYVVVEDCNGKVLVLRSLEQKNKAIKANAEKFVTQLKKVKSAGSNDNLSGYKVVRSIYKKLFQRIDEQFGTRLQYDEALLNLAPFTPYILLATFLFGPRLFSIVQSDLINSLDFPMQIIDKVV